MTFVVGPFISGTGRHAHALKVDYMSALDLFTGRTMCGRRGGVRATWQMHQMRAAYSKLKEAASPCAKCMDVLERRMG